MCLNLIVKRIAEKDIKVWKVFRKEDREGISFVFRGINGAKLYGNFSPVPKELPEVSYGYHSFLNEEVAKDYITCMTGSLWDRKDFVIKEFCIKEEDEYEIGFIPYPFKGSGLQSVRSKKLFAQEEVENRSVSLTG